jgi:hypothetical protein
VPGANLGEQVQETGEGTCSQKTLSYLFHHHMNNTAGSRAGTYTWITKAGRNRSLLAEQDSGIKQNSSQAQS